MIGTEGRSSVGQAGYQIAATFLTLCICIVSGAFTGWFTSLPFCLPPPEDKLFDDRYSWVGTLLEEKNKDVERVNKIRKGINDLSKSHNSIVQDLKSSENHAHVH